MIILEEAEEISDDAVEALLNRLSEIQTPIPNGSMRSDESILSQIQGNKTQSSIIDEKLTDKNNNFEVPGNRQSELEV